MRPRDIKTLLESLPRTLDEMYDRILQNIDATRSREAFATLQWLAFSERPLYLAELAEACVVNPSQDPVINENDRFPPQDLFKFLSSLITVLGQVDSFDFFSEIDRSCRQWELPAEKTEIFFLERLRSGFQVQT